MISVGGKAQIRNRNMESFSLELMVVSRIIFGGSDWVGFLGHHKVENSDGTRRKSKTQFLEIFSQMNLANCLLTITAEHGSNIEDVAVQTINVDTFALACEDGSVIVKELMTNIPEQSFCLNDASDQLFTSETRHMVQHSFHRMSHVIYHGHSSNQYCAASGTTLFSGQSDAENTFRSPITQLKTLVTRNHSTMVAVGLGDIGEIQILDPFGLTRQMSIRLNSLAISRKNFLDFAIIGSNHYLSTQSEHSIMILTEDEMISFRIKE